MSSPFDGYTHVTITIGDVTEMIRELDLLTDGHVSPTSARRLRAIRNRLAELSTHSPSPTPLPITLLDGSTLSEHPLVADLRGVADRLQEIIGSLTGMRVKSPPRDGPFSEESPEGGGS